MSVSMAGMKNSEIVIGEGITEKFYILSLLDTVKIKPTPIIVNNNEIKIFSLCQVSK